METQESHFMKAFIWKDQYLLHKTITYLKPQDIINLRSTNKQVEQTMAENKLTLSAMQRAFQRIDRPQFPMPTHYYYYNKHLMETAISKLITTEAKYWFYKMRLKHTNSLHFGLGCLHRDDIQSLITAKPEKTLSLIITAIKEIQTTQKLDPSFDQLIEIYSPAIYDHETLTKLLKNLFRDIHQHTKHSHDRNYLSMFTTMYCSIYLHHLIKDIIEIARNHQMKYTES